MRTGIRDWLLLTTALSALAAAPAPAQSVSQFWDGTNTTPGGVVLGRGGDGTWNGTATNWTDVNGTANAAWAGQTGYFQGAAGTVSVAGALAFRDLEINTSGYRFSFAPGASLVTADGGSTIIGASGVSTTITGLNVTGTDAIYFSGGGSTLVVNGGTIATDTVTGGVALTFNNVAAAELGVTGNTFTGHDSSFGAIGARGDFSTATVDLTGGTAKSVELGSNSAGRFTDTSFSGTTAADKAAATIGQFAGDLRLRNNRIAASADYFADIYSQAGTADGSGVGVDTSGVGSDGILIGGAGDADISNSTVVTRGRGARGAAVALGGTLRINDSKISTLGDAIPEGQRNGGLGAYGIGVEFPDASVTATDVAIYTAGEQGFGLAVREGQATFIGGSITTGIQLADDGTPVTLQNGRAAASFYLASGKSQGVGVGALDGGRVTLNFGDRGNTTVETYGDAGLGFGAQGGGSSITATGVDITTHGTTAASPFGEIAAHGIAVTDGATVTTTGTDITTTGAGSSGAFVLGSGTIDMRGPIIKAASAALEIAPVAGATNLIIARDAELAGRNATLAVDFGANDLVANFTLAGALGSSDSGKLLAVRRDAGVTGGYVSLNVSDGSLLAGDIDALDGTTVVFQGETGGGRVRLLSGTLGVNGSLANDSVEIASGATLQGPTSLPTSNGPTLLGAASITGPVTIADGGTLNGLDIQTLTMGSLLLNDSSIVRAEISSNALTQPLFKVTGALTLDGRLTIVERDGFGNGTYRLFDYGTLAANNGLVITNVPTGYNPGDFRLATATAGRVNLVVAEGLGTQYWDGPNQTPGMVANGRGGDGTWNASSTNWTNQPGDINAPWAGGTAVFKAEAAPFTDNNVTIDGIQTLTGLTLLPGARYIFTAGTDGGLSIGAAETPFTVDPSDDASATGGIASIDAPISGAGMLVKRGVGLVELYQANSYSGGTRIEAGQINAVGNGSLGSGAITVSGPTARLGVGASTFGDRNSDYDLGDRTIAVSNGGSVGLNNGSRLGAGNVSVAGAAASGQHSELLFGGTSDAGTSRIQVGRDGDLYIRGLASVADATIENEAGGYINLQFAQGDVRFGSLSGSGELYLGFNRALIGALGDDDTISGVISDNTSDDGRVDGMPIGIRKEGTGTLTLAGGNIYTGLTEVTGGRLLVNGSVAGDVRVGTEPIMPMRAEGSAVIAPSPTLGGSGTIGGAVTIESGSVLQGRASQTLGMAALTLASGSSVNVALGAPSDTRLFNVTGNLALDGTLDVTDAGGFGDGVYRLFDYGGSFTDNGLDVAALPGARDGTVQTVLANQVNLVVSSVNPMDPTGPDDPMTPAPEIQFWNGTTTSRTGTVVGGSGSWTNAAITNWTDANGTRSDAWAGKLAVFQGTGGASSGVVRVDGSAGAISARGLQFVGQGWSVVGDPITLAGADGATTIRVGDGSADSTGDVAVIDARLTGSSKLVKDDLGTLVLTGANDYSGGTRVANGTLRVGDGGTSGSITGDLTVDGTLEFARSDATGFGGAISGGGTLRIANGSLALTADNSFSGVTRIAESGTLRLGSGGTSGSLAGPITVAGTLVFDRSNSFTYGSVLSGAGTLRQAGSGMTVLTGASDGFVGTTRVEAGTLAVNGALGGRVRVAGGRLQGNGTIGGLDVGGRSTVAPGNSIGVLSVAGDVGFTTGSTYEVEADASGASDRVAASGAATIAGGHVSVLAAEGRYALTTDYTILSANGGVIGAFDDVTSNSVFLAPSLAYGATSVTLRLMRNGIDLASVGGTANQRSVGAAVDALAAGPVFMSALLLDAGEARAAFNSLSGEIHPSVRTAMVEDARLPREAVLRRLATAPDEGRGAWGELFGNWGRNDADGNAARLSRDTKGFIAGIDATAGEHVRVGIAGGYGDNDLSIGARASNGSLKSAHVLAYAGGSFGGLRLKAGFGYAHIDIDTRRQVNFPGFSDSLKAKYDGRLLQGFAELGYVLPLGGGAIEPFADIAHVDARTDGFTERGGAAALSAGKRNESYTASTLGARLSTPVAGALSAHATLGWRHGFGDLTQRTRLSFAGGAQFAVAGAPLSRDAGVGEFGAALRLSPRLTFDASYTGALGGQSEDNAARVRISFAF